MNKKILLLLGGIGLLFIVIGVVFAWITQRPQVQDFSGEIERAQSSVTNENAPPRQSSFTPPVAERLIIDGVTMRNFYTTERARSAGNVVFFENLEYQLAYVINRNEFVITVMSTDFTQQRLLAEKAFLAELEITEEEACQLNVIIQNPSIFNPSSGDERYSLSFCE